MERRRKYDREFKIETVRLVTEEGRKAAEVARDPGIHVNLIYLWKKQLSEDAYDWRGRCESRRSTDNRVLLSHIRMVHKQSRETYGSPRVRVELNESGNRLW